MYSEIIMKEKFKLNFKIFFVCLFFAIINCYSVYYDKPLRLLFTNLSYIIIINICYKKSLVKSIILDLIFLMVSIFSELLFSIVYYFFIGNNCELRNT